MRGSQRDVSGQEKEGTLKDALNRFLKSSGMESLIKYPALTTAWNKFVGEEIAEHARIWSFRRGTLEIAVDSSSLMNDIEFSRGRLLRALQNEVKRPFVARLSFVLKPSQDEHD